MEFDSWSGVQSWIQSQGLLGHAITYIASLGTIFILLLKYAGSIHAEIVRLRMQFHNNVAGELMKARLGSYPALYKEISELAKVGAGFSSDHLTLTMQVLSDVGKRLNDWDSQNAIVLSPAASAELWRLRIAIRDLVNDYSGGGPQLEGGAIYAALISHIGRLELSLKSDLGVFSLDDYIVLKRPRNYTEAGSAARGRRRWSARR